MNNSPSEGPDSVTRPACPAVLRFCGGRSLIFLPLAAAAIYIVFSILEAPNLSTYVLSDTATAYGTNRPRLLADNLPDLITSEEVASLANDRSLRTEEIPHVNPSFKEIDEKSDLLNIASPQDSTWKTSTSPASKPTLEVRTAFKAWQHNRIPRFPTTLNNGIPTRLAFRPNLKFENRVTKEAVPSSAENESSFSTTASTRATKVVPIAQQPVENAEFRYAVHRLLDINSTFNPFEYLVQPNVCKEGKFVPVVVYIAIPPQDSGNRQKLRQYWTNEAKSYGIEVVFALGRASGNATANNADIKMIQKENEIYGDLLLANYEDSYKHLIVKYWVSLHYYVNYCSHVPYMIHMDSDTIIYAKNFMNYLSHNKEAFANNLGCQVFGGARVKQKGHIWYVPDEVWPKDHFLTYCHGILILSSLQTSARLLDAVPKLGIDYFTAYTIWDVATGPLAKIAEVPMSNIPGLHQDFSSKFACNNETVAVHRLKDPERVRAMMQFRRDCCKGAVVVCTNRTALPEDQRWIL